MEDGFVPQAFLLSTLLALVRRNFPLKKTQGTIRPRTDFWRKLCVVLVLLPSFLGSFLS
jgi:hypothetical protein